MENNSDDKDSQNKELQQLLALAHAAIKRVKDHGRKHSLPFEIDGVRFGPVDDDTGGWSVDLDHNDHLSEDEDPLPLQMDALDVSQEWCGSWSPGC